MSDYTEKQIATYIELSGNFCPECGSANIQSLGMIEPDVVTASQAIVCKDCEKTWRDEYTLVGISKDDG